MKIYARWLGIQCYKHDGTFHRSWDRGLVVENNDDFIMVATKKTKVIESNGRRWFTKEPAVTIFSKKEWWNVICMLKNDGICYYCNIASPSVLDNELIKYIDYDLDAKLLPNKEIKVLDEKEYAHHKNKYSYSDELDKVLKNQTEKVLEKMKNNEFPFDDSSISMYYDRFLSILEKYYDKNNLNNK